MLHWLRRCDQAIVAWTRRRLRETYEGSVKELRAEKDFWEDTLRVWIQYWPMGVAFFFGWKIFLTTIGVSMMLYVLRRKLVRSKEIK